MADFKQNYFQRRTKDRGPRSNNRISSPDVQVIASDGENLGVMNTNEAISMAKNQGLDLIEIAANANPPVCKIMDMGKFKYDAQKKANIAKKKQKIVLLKEIKSGFSPPLEKVVLKVQQDYLTQAQDKAIAEYINEIRSQYRVIINPDYKF